MARQGMAKFEVVDDRIVAILRTKSPGERLEMAFRAVGFARELIEASVRRTTTGLSEAEIKQQVLRRLRSGTA